MNNVVDFENFKRGKKSAFVTSAGIINGTLVDLMTLNGSDFIALKDVELIPLSGIIKESDIIRISELSLQFSQIIAFSSGLSFQCQ